MCQGILECEVLVGTRSAEGIMASGHVNRIKRPNTWLHRPMLQNREESSCQTGAVHTWHLADAGVLANVRFVPCVDGSGLARAFFTSQAWSVLPCVRPIDAVHMTAGHNALRGSGPGQKPAFDNAWGQLDCPDRRIDRLCITCCSSSQPSKVTGGASAIAAPVLKKLEAVYS